MPEQVPLDTQSFFKKRDAKTSAIRKRPATPPPTDSDSSGYTSTEDEGRKVKRRRKSNNITVDSSVSRNHTLADLAPTNFAADRTAQISDTNDGTKQSNWTDEKALVGTARAHLSNLSSTDLSTADDGTYKGASAYQSFVPKNRNASPRTVGPIKGPTNIRTTTITDFAPEVCKDYKKTGFCGFSDSCKFLHARENYKQGWELDKDWEIGSKDKKKKEANTQRTGDGIYSEREDAVLETIPSACLICKNPYTKPIVTKCGHYFCETCALQRYRKNPSCAACAAGTGGVFNAAKGLRQTLKERTGRAKKRRGTAIADGENVSSEDDKGTREEKPAK